ncbi:hypothetical protein TRVA0_053S00298 [Trichomonascus vanleenenianus]|uniref:dienelactone hydrolase family protein n=1 Tax=Trichomonascus vanleenenianus TaxID=2268995 RepID=UPI003EC9A0AB
MAPAEKRCVNRGTGLSPSFHRETTPLLIGILQYSRMADSKDTDPLTAETPTEMEQPTNVESIDEVGAGSPKKSLEGANPEGPAEGDKSDNSSKKDSIDAMSVHSSHSDFPPPVPEKDGPPVPAKDYAENPYGAESRPEPYSGSTLLGQKFVLSQTQTQAYVTQSPSSQSSTLVILLTNSLGLSSENNLRLADMYSNSLNCPVIVPDMFSEDPIPTHGVVLPEEIGHADVSLLDRVKASLVGGIKGFMEEMWLARHTFEKTYPLLVSAVAEIVDVYKPRKVAVIGYSFGGRYVLPLLEGQENDEWSSDEDLICVGAAIHPSLIKAADFNVVKKPLFLVAPHNDEMLPDSLVQAGISNLQSRNIEFQKMFFGGEGGDDEPQLPHGFAVPGDYSYEEVGDRPQQVMNVVSNWILEHL